MSPKITQNDPRGECYTVTFCVCSDHQSNTKNISTKFHERMLNCSHKKEERKKNTKMGQNNPKCPLPHIQSFREKHSIIPKKWWNIQRSRQTDKLKQTD